MSEKGGIDIGQIAMIGALIVGGHFLYKMFSEQGTGGVSGGGGWTEVVREVPIETVVYREPRTQAEAVTQAQQAGATVYTRKVGSYQPYIAIQPVSTRAALLTVGTPAQQIQQYNVAPRLIKVGGVTRKVM